MFDSPLLLRRSKNYCISERVFVAVFIQHAKCMCPTILSSVACHGSTLSNKWQDFREQVTEHKNVSFDRLYKVGPKHFSFFQ